jgi:hypothetical protein
MEGLTLLLGLLRWLLWYFLLLLQDFLLIELLELVALVLICDPREELLISDTRFLYGQNDLGQAFRPRARYSIGNPIEVCDKRVRLLLQSLISELWELPLQVVLLLC